MCVIISIENIISNYFALHKDKKQVSLSTLGHYKEKIELEFRAKNRFVWINYTKSSLANAILLNAELFSLKDNFVVYEKNDAHASLLEEMGYFNSKLPHSIKDDYLKIFKEIQTS